jgi:hypothetical protein
MANAGSLNQHPSFAGEYTLKQIDLELQKVSRLKRFWEHQRSRALFGAFVMLMSVDVIGRHITSFLIPNTVFATCNDDHDRNDSAVKHVLDCLYGFLFLFSNLHGFSDLYPKFLNLLGEYARVTSLRIYSGDELDDFCKTFNNGYKINANVHFFRHPCHRENPWRDHHRCKGKCTSDQPCYFRNLPLERVYVTRLIKGRELPHPILGFFLSGCLSGELFDKALRSFLMSVPPPMMTDADSSKYLRSFLKGDPYKNLRNTIKIPPNFLQMILLSYLKGTHSLILFLLSFDINGEVFNQDDYYWAHGRVHVKKGRDQTIPFERLFQFCRKIIGTFSTAHLSHDTFDNRYVIKIPFNIFLCHVFNMPPFLSHWAIRTVSKKQGTKLGVSLKYYCMINHLAKNKVSFETRTGKIWRFVPVPTSTFYKSHLVDIKEEQYDQKQSENLSIDSLIPKYIAIAKLFEQY